MQSGAQANGLLTRAHGRLRGQRIATSRPKRVASVCPHPGQSSYKSAHGRAGMLADTTVPRCGILINVPAIRK